MSKDNKKTKRRELWKFCLKLYEKYGSAMDATRFKNELHMRFYGEDTKELLVLGLNKHLYHLKAGNLIFHVYKFKKTIKEITHED
ncbi:MAG: hypothetical protein IJM04_07205 [Prevotella sp.]|nr:hypothetical protein [Prevotella sp.]